MIDPQEKLIPSSSSGVHQSLLYIYYVRPQNVHRVGVSHVKRCSNDALFGAFAAFDRVVRWLVGVSHTSQWPAGRHFTWGIVTESTF